MMEDLDYEILHAASVDQHKLLFPWQGVKLRAKTLGDQGFLVKAGFSVCHGDIYALTPKGEGALAKQVKPSSAPETEPQDLAARFRSILDRTISSKVDVRGVVIEGKDNAVESLIEEIGGRLPGFSR